MSRLSTEAEQLVRAGRSVLQPSEADRERVFQGLLSRLDTRPLGPDGVTELSRTPAIAKGTLVKISSVLVGLGVAGGSLFWLLQPDPQADAGAADAAIPALTPPANSGPDAPERAAPLPPVEVPVTPDSAAPSRGAGEEARETAAARPRTRAARRAPVSPTGDSLAREVALLSRASTELHAGRFAVALEALDEHERSFPSGALAQERSAARARALCGLGRMKEGQAELARLARSAPGSPHAARAEQACALPGAERK